MLTFLSIYLNEYLPVEMLRCGERSLDETSFKKRKTEWRRNSTGRNKKKGGFYKSQCLSEKNSIKSTISSEFNDG